jgi:DNA-binding phage protein
LTLESYSSINKAGDTTMKKKLQYIKFNLDRIKTDRNLSVIRIKEMTGVSRPTIYGLLSGRISPSITTINKLAHGLKIDPMALWRVE